MARGGSLNLAGAVVNQVCLFVITSLLALTLGKNDVGRYATSYALLSLLGLLSLVGFRSALTRFVAIYLADADPARIRGTVRLGMVLSFGASALLGALLALLAGPIASHLHDPVLADCLRLTGLTLPAATLSDAALSGTQGWRTQRPFTYIGRIFEPVLRLALTGLALFGGAGILGAMWALAVAAWLAAALACVSLVRRVRTVPPARPILPMREIFSFSMISWVSALSSTGLIWADTLILTAMKGTGDVGVYNVSTRIVTLAVFVMAPINAAFAPHIAYLHHIGEVGELERNYRSATTWIVRLALPAFIMLLVFPQEILHLFGKEFATGALVTVILGAGQLVNAATGPCGTVLNMSGKVMINMADNLGALIFNVVLNLLLIPPFGIVGAAIAWSLSLALVNLLRVYQVRRLMGVSPFGAGIAKGLVAAVVAAVIAEAIHLFVGPWWLALLCGGLAVAATYPLMVWRLGVNRDDLEVMRAVLGGRRGRRPRTA